MSTPSRSSKENDGKPTIFLLKVLPTAGYSKFDMDNQNFAFKSLQNAKHSPKWLTEDEILSRGPPDRNIYILPRFDENDKVFTHLKELNCKVYGAPALCSCLERGISLPNGNFIFSLTLDKAVICFTGIPAEIRVISVSGFEASARMDIAHLIELHGGTYSAQMARTTCTHLIAASNSGEKYEVYWSSQIRHYL
ncbi:twin BRCT domain-containing protein [Ditylenchus destructor]|nr:twin BRCT domain-containing protein [Ditylenchus destructor]